MEARLRRHLDDPRTPYRGDMRIAQRNGGWVWVQAFGSVVERDGTGRAQRMLGLHINISARKRHAQQLQISAFSDALTGLPNRAALLLQLAAVVARQRDAVASNASTAGHFGLLLLDFDRFKQVNDSLGHAAGDALRCQIAQRLQGALRSGDAVSRAAGGVASTAARLGGDEFVVLAGACRAWGVEAKFGPSEDSFCRVCRPIAVAMGQKAGVHEVRRSQKWTAAAKLQPTIPKSDRRLDRTPFAALLGHARNPLSL